MRAGWLAPLVLLAQAPDGGRLSTADLPAYRRALADVGGPAEAVGFRALWEGGESYRGRRVEVRGRLARRFAQPAFGDFPPLTEAWLWTPGDNPICLVYPTPGGDRADARLGTEVRFVGTYLRRVRYEGGDAPRLAPLIVGPEAPAAVPGRVEIGGGGIRAPRWTYWAGAVGMTASLAGLAAWLALRRPESGYRGSPGTVEFRTEADDEARGEPDGP